MKKIEDIGGKFKRFGCVSYDGSTINTRLLHKKKMVVQTKKAFAKDITFDITEEALKKLVAMIVAAPRLNGNGTIVK